MTLLGFSLLAWRDHRALHTNKPRRVNQRNDIAPEKSDQSLRESRWSYTLPLSLWAAVRDFSQGQRIFPDDDLATLQ